MVCFMALCEVISVVCWVALCAMLSVELCTSFCGDINVCRKWREMRWRIKGIESSSVCVCVW